MTAAVSLVQSALTHQGQAARGGHVPDCDPGPKSPDDLLTLAGISKEFEVSRQTPYDWMDSGLEPDECALGGGKSVPLFRRSTVEAYIESRPRVGRPLRK